MLKDILQRIYFKTLPTTVASSVITYLVTHTTSDLILTPLSRDSILITKSHHLRSGQNSKLLISSTITIRVATVVALFT